MRHTSHKTFSPLDPLTSLLSTLKDPSCQEDGTLDVVREAAQGHLDIVRDFLLKHPEKVSHAPVLFSL